ncbi:MOSC domain-containing protein [Jannaschia sp. S6380]|uniref:MOSC domain-containing protein n=1 Tax=Jannaschia sp. S6380 TaxID=2926408 RepID=UPI0032B1CB6A
MASQPLTELALGFAGPEGETHGGLTRPSCSRVLSQHRRGTEIRNTRQLSVVSAEELALIAASMRLSTLDPSWLGATLVLSGIPDLSHLPPSSRLQAEDGATIVVDMANRPCNLPAAVIAEASPQAARRFKPAAKGRRGVTAWVERPGRLKLGMWMTLHVPDQRPWSVDPFGDREVSGQGQPGQEGEGEAGHETGVNQEAGSGHADLR